MGGNSKPRNPRMQTMLRMIGFGDNAGSGFPDILKTWSDNGWDEPELYEDTIMNQVSLTLKITNEAQIEGNLKKVSNNVSNSAQNERSLSEVLSEVMSSSDSAKTLALARIIDEQGYITPKQAMKVTGKSSATVRRYLKLMTDTDYVVSEGDTNTIIYKRNPLH